LRKTAKSLLSCHRPHSSAMRYVSLVLATYSICWTYGAEFADTAAKKDSLRENNAEAARNIQNRQVYPNQYFDPNNRNNPSGTFQQNHNNNNNNINLQNGRYNSNNNSYSNPYNNNQYAGQQILKPYMGPGPGPVIPPYPGSTMNGTASPLGPGPTNEGSVSVHVQLRGYTNQLLRIDPTRTCSCPQNSARCFEVSPQRLGFRCFFSFMIIISSADSSVQYRATPFVMLTQAGTIDPAEMNSFQQNFNFLLSHQPTAVDIFVHHLGAVINGQTGELEQANTVYHVDTFVQLLNTSTNQQTMADQQATLTGQLLGTQLSLSYSVKCRGSLVGPGCDLQCNTSSVSSGNAVCVSQKTGYFSLCRWSGSQVTECQNCPWGIRDNAYCIDQSGGVLEANRAGVVSAGFETATIILAIACGILLLLLIVACLYSCLRARREQRRTSTTAPGYNAGTSYHSEYRTHAGEAEARPLQSAPNGTPQAAPRNHPPPLTAKPNKSVLRAGATYQLPPPAHLGGIASLNDTLNSSFSGSQAAPNVSVSADV
jgi:hypothetical protein